MCVCVCGVAEADGVERVPDRQIILLATPVEETNQHKERTYKLVESSKELV